MSRDQKIKIAMVVCAVIVACAVIITSTGMFSGSGIASYANADKYTAGETEITGEIKNLDINWTAGRVIIAYHAGNTAVLRESAKRSLSDDEKLQWWLDGDTLRVQFARSGIRWNMPEKTLTVTLPEGIALEKASIQTTSGDVEIPSMKAKELDLGSTSGDINAAAETEKTVIGSTSGSMRIRLAGETESVSLISTSGSIALETEKAKTIKAGSTSGGIAITAAECEEAKAGSTSGSICVEFGKVKKLSISATSGSVTAKLPEDPGFTATVEMTSGSFSSDVALTRDGNRYACGDGSAIAEIGTTSGDVRIEAAGAK